MQCIVLNLIPDPYKDPSRVFGEILMGCVN